ncbi:MAG: 1-deoxy-D-xylulose-5-phosphate reductoisomerase [Spirochaetota bacterium]
MKRRFILFGATGSIGDSTLDVLRQRSDEFELVGFTWHQNETKAQALQAEFPRAVAFSTAAAGAEEQTRRLLDLPHEFVIVAIVGAAGVNTTLEAARRGDTILLANKESLVIAGDVVMAQVKASGAKLIPVDSEHSSLYRLLYPSPPTAPLPLLRGGAGGGVSRVYLTASGGPLLHVNGDAFFNASKEVVLKHPTWVMGQKITVDSAGLTNKALEIIEAHYLFDLPYDQVQAVIHPQSYVHAMVELSDGTVLQHISQPDMRYPIAWAMYYPQPSPDTVKGRVPAAYPALDFFPVDTEKFRSYALGRRAGEMGKYYPAVFNAANEAAVAAFLAGDIRFGEIAVLVEHALEMQYAGYDYTSIDGLLQYDNAARETVKKRVFST